MSGVRSRRGSLEPLPKRTRPRQEDRLLPLGAYQWLVLLACFELGSGANALNLHRALIAAGLSETNLGQVFVTLHRLLERGFITATAGRSPIDPTRKARVYTLTRPGQEMLVTSDENYGRVVAVAKRLKERR